MKRILALFALLAGFAAAQSLPTTRVGNLVVTGTVSVPADSLELSDVAGLIAALDGKLDADGDGSALTGLHWSQIGGTPTTLAGYGITDAVPSSRTLTAGAGIATLGDLSANRTVALTGQALALHNLATSGLITRTGAGTVAARTITATAPLAVSNGNGVSGNPALTIAAASTTTVGASRLATIAETATGTAANIGVTPAGLKPALDARVADTLASASLVFAWGVDDAVASFSGVSVGGGDFYLSAFVRLFSSGSNHFIHNYMSGVAPRLYVTNGGSLRVAPSFGADVVASSAGAFAFGEWQHVEYVRAAGVGTLYIDGVAVATGIDAIEYSGEIGRIGDSAAVISLRGAVSRALVGNYAPDAAERAELFASLGIPRPERMGGTPTTLLGLTWTDWFEDAGLVTTGIDNFSITGPVGGGYARISGDVVVRRGQRLRLQFLAGGTFVTGPANRAYLENDDLGTRVSYTSGSNDLVITATQTGPTRLVFAVLAGEHLAVTELSVATEGLLYLQPDADQGAGPVLRARTGPDTLLPGDGHTTGGVVRANPAIAPYVLRYSVTGSGNRLIGGADVRRVPPGWRVTAIETDLSVSASLTIGTSSAGSDIVASVNPGTGRRQLTLVQPLPDPARLWIGGTLTGDIYLTIAP